MPLLQYVMCRMSRLCSLVVLVFFVLTFFLQFSFCKNLCWTSIFSFLKNLNKIDALSGFRMSGLVTRLTDDQKYGIIEAIAHLIHRDYDEIVKDFVKLDFIPDGVNLEPILPVLAKVFDQALEGGGAKNINFQELASDLAQITFDYPFRIPPYFALIIRAIGVLEGIALVGNPDFAIVDEAYPYLAQVYDIKQPFFTTSYMMILTITCDPLYFTKKRIILSPL